MKTTILVVGVIKHGDNVLLRKKPEGSLPYKETWYLFSGVLSAEQQHPERALQENVLRQTGLTIRPVERLSWDTETKSNHDGDQEFYVYVDYLCEYVSGELTPSEDIERLEWVPISELADYDLVPPSRKLFRRLGYLS